MLTAAYSVVKRFGCLVLSQPCKLIRGVAACASHVAAGTGAVKNVWPFDEHAHGRSHADQKGLCSIAYAGRVCFLMRRWRFRSQSLIWCGAFVAMCMRAYICLCAATLVVTKMAY